VVEEMDAPQAALGPPGGAGSDGEDVVMVPVDGDSAPPPPVREHDVAMLAAPESSAAATTASVEGTTDTSSSRYVDFPGIRIIDIDATELPSNDWEIREVATEQMFVDQCCRCRVKMRVLAAWRPPPRRRRRRGFSGSPQPARSQL
jgi:hypothetical protein